MAYTTWNRINIIIYIMLGIQGFPKKKGDRARKPVKGEFTVFLLSLNGLIQVFLTWNVRCIFHAQYKMKREVITEGI